MVSKKMILTNSLGFHVRPAGMFTHEMEQFLCDVWIYYQGAQINGKSIMNIIASCIKCGSEIEIRCDGTDEQEALAKAIELIENGLGE